MKRILSCLAVILLLPACGRAGGVFRTVLQDSVWEEQPVVDYTGEVRITFLGDCTLGGEEKSRNSALGFRHRIRENGLDFPFRNLLGLTAGDDLTVANLEVVLSDRTLKKEKKKYNFMGPTAYTGILTSGSVEAVTVANNHSHDYGTEGYEDTKAALDQAGVGWFGTDAPAVWENSAGLRIGWIGVNYNMTGSRWKSFQQQMETLRALGCAAVITVMHAGTEYDYTAPDRHQRQISERAADGGSCLIIGHHPHVVQGYAVLGGVPVVYSLGNCSFGGTTHAKDSDALAVQAVLAFEEGELRRIDLHFHPLSITSDSHYNNYSPCLLTGNDAERVLKKMRDSTGCDPGTWEEDTGAVVTFPVPAE